MRAQRLAAIARHDLRVLRSDPVFFIVIATMPLIMMAFLKDSSRFALAADGAIDVNGAEQTVPGMTVMFSLFQIGTVGYATFREHGWGTWERIRASSVTSAELFVGKSLAPLLQALVQVFVLLVVGGFLFGLHVRGSVLAVGVVALLFALSLVAIGQLVAVLCKSVLELNAIAYLGAVIFAGLGGALAPLSTLPGWTSAVAPATPSYWAMRAFRTLIIEGGSIDDVAAPIGMLAAFFVAFGTLAALRFRADETKSFLA